MAQEDHNSASGTSERVFAEAREQFLSSITAQERSRFSQCSADELLTGIEDTGKFAQEKRKWTVSFARIRDFSDKLKPYFEVCNIVLQSHPEWSAIAWGAFRLVLQVSLHLSRI